MNKGNFKLKRGDKVTIIAPASHLREEDKPMLALGHAILEKWGLNPVSVCKPGKPHYYLSGDDQHRAGELNLALADTEIKAVFSIRGGYGSARILQMIEYDAPITEKFFCGFSDLTTLQFAFDKRVPSITNLHGPNIATAQFINPGPEGDLNRSRLKQALFTPDLVHHESISVIRPGQAQGRLIGGCLSLICALMGTPYEPDFDNAILFIEDVGEKPFRIDRMLTHLKTANVFDRVNAVVLGDFSNCVSPSINLENIIEDLFSFARVPVVSGLRVGHGKINLALRIGQTAKIDTELKQLSLG